MAYSYHESCLLYHIVVRINTFKDLAEILENSLSARSVSFNMPSKHKHGLGIWPKQREMAFTHCLNKSVDQN